MRTRLTVVASLVPVLSLILAARGDEKADAFKQLEGRWKVVAIEKAGKRLPDEIVKQMPGQIVIADGKIRGMVGDKMVYEGNFAIDVTKTPKTYEMTGAKDRKGREVVTRGIWEIDAKGQLRKCFNNGSDAKPPKSFDTKETPGADLIIYERVN